MTSVKLSKGIERFLWRWARTKGFGMDWYLQGGNQIRTKRCGCCPLTAEFRTPAVNYRKAAREIGLRVKAADELAYSADWTLPVLGRRAHARAVAIRRRLLRGVGLSEP